MKIHFLKSISLAFFLLCFASLRAACYNISATETVTTQANPLSPVLTLSVCTPYLFTYQITNTSSTAVTDDITINLPGGITYSSFVSVSGAGASYLSGTASPVFSVSGWAAGSTMTLVFVAQSPECDLVTTPNTVSTIAGINTCNTFSVSNNLAIVPPTLAVINFSGSGSLLKNIGDVDELVFEIKNISANGAAIPQINMTASPDPTITFLGDYYISTSATPASGNNIYTYSPPTFTPGSVTASTPIGSGISLGAADWNFFYGTNGFPQGQTLYIHVPYKVDACAAPGGIYDFTWGCGSTVCNTQQVNSSISVIAGNPSVTVQNYAPFNNGTFCAAAGTPTSVVLGFNYKNNGTPIVGAPAGNAKATNMRVYWYGDAAFGTLNLSSLQLISGLNTISIPSGIITSTSILYSGRTINIYDINLSLMPLPTPNAWNPLGANTLADLDGDGFVDDLSELSSFYITGTYDYNTTTCPLSTNCGAGYSIMATQLKYNNQCFTIVPPDVRQSVFSVTNTPNGNYYYSASGSAATLTAPADVQEGYGNAFTAQMCTEPYYERFGPTGFEFDCPSGYHQIKFPLPPGYHLNGTGLTQIAPGVSGVNSALYQFPPIVAVGRCGGTQTINPTIQEICQPGSTPGYIILNFGQINASNCGPWMETFMLPCINMPLYMDCNGTLADCPTIAPNFGFDDLSFSLEYICDPGCNTCVSEIVCASTTTYHHCLGPCDSYFSTNNDFTFLRQTLGFNNSNPLYDCVNPVQPLTTNTAPTIDLSAAYPGDLIETKVSGSFSGTHTGFTTHTGANYNDIYLQIRHEDLLSTTRANYRLFDLDATQGGITITNTNTSATLFVPASTLIYTHGVNLGNVEMSFNLSAAGKAFISSPTDLYTFDADIFLYARATPALGSGSTFYSLGVHPLVSLRAEFMGTRTDGTTIDYSCDSWGSHFTMLQPQESIGYYPGTFGSSFNNTSTCAPFRANLLFSNNGPRWWLGQDDFENEFRSYAVLNPNVTVTIPPGYTYLGSQYVLAQAPYSSTGTNGFPTTAPGFYGYPITGEITTGNSSVGTTINYNGISGGSSCWPLMDLDYFAFRPVSMIQVMMQPTCTAPPSAFIGFSGSYTEGVQQTNPAYQVTTNFNYTNFPLNHVNPVLSVNPPASTVNGFTNTLTFDFSLCNTNTAAANQGWIALENSLVNGLNLSSATVQVLPGMTSLPTATYIDGNGNTALMVYVGNVPVSLCTDLRLTATVNTNGCVASGSGPVLDFITVRYGNQCDGTVVASPDLSCEQGSVQFPFQRYPSDLQLLVPPGGFPTAPVDLCNGSLQYNFIMNSSEIGAISNPAFWMDLPTGVSLVNATFTYPCGTGSTVTLTAPDASTFGSGSLPGWNLNSHFSSLLTNGLTGTTTFPNNQICVTVNLQTSCDYNATDYIYFYTGGVSSCSQILTPPAAQHRPTINDALPLDDLSLSWSMTTSDAATNVNCSNTATFTVTVANNGSSSNLHNTTLTVTVPGSPFVINPGSGTLSGTTITWNIPSGTIPVSGTTNYTFTVSLANALFCQSNIPISAILGFNETVSCNETGGSCAFDYQSAPAGFAFDACCETVPCEVIPNFSYTIDNCTVNFIDLSTANGTIYAWNWTVTDMNTNLVIDASSVQNPSFTFPGSGSYKICLVAAAYTDDDKCTAEYCTEIKVECKPCEIKPNFNYSINNCTVKFTDLSTATGTIYAWNWTFTDLSTSTVVGTSTLQNPSFTFPGTGAYEACLVVEAYQGGVKCTAKYCTKFKFKCEPCDIKAKFKFKFGEDCVVSFGAVASTSPGTTIIGWSWDFGDPASGVNNTSNLQNPTHFFNGTGFYNVCLTVTAVNGEDTCTFTICDVVKIKCPCEVHADFVYKSANCNFQFTDNSVSPYGTIIDWSWDFGDPASGANNTSNLQNPAHIFSASGSYDVCLTVTSVNGKDTCVDTYCQKIKVDCEPCDVKAKFKFKFGEDCVVSFGAVASTSPGTTIIGWSWDFGDPASGVNNTSNLQNPTHFFNGTGFYNVCLTVTAVNGEDTCTFTICDVVKIKCPCEVHASFNYKTQDCTTQFGGSAISPYGTVISYTWNFGDPASGANNTAVGQFPSHTFSASGTYNVCVTVTSVNGKDTCVDTYCQLITVKCPDCEVFPKFDYKLDNCTAYFTDFSYATGTIYAWNWEYFDAFGNSIGTSNVQNPSFTFPASGTYKVCLTVSAHTANQKCKEQLCIEIKVDCKPCEVTPKFTYKLEDCTAYFTDLSFATGTIYAWNWEYFDAFGNSIGTSNVQNPSFAFPASGTYKVCLTVSAFIGEQKCKEQLCIEINVDCKPCDITPKFDYKLDNCTAYFTDYSTATGTIYDWTWEYFDAFGNSIGTSNVQNPSFTFPGSGTYKVCLTVLAYTATQKCKEQLCIEIKVDCKPCDVKADFKYQVKKCKVQFGDMSTSAAGIVSWQWDFGDGTSSNAQNPLHIFPGSGTYHVCLTVTSIQNGVECKDTKCYDITLTCPFQLPCNVTAAFNFTGAMGSKTRTFTDLSTTTGTITSWAWTFGDGGTSTLQNPTHTYASFGTYNVCLIVTAVKGGQTCSDTICKTVKLKNVFNPFDIKSDMVVSPNPTSEDAQIKLTPSTDGTATVEVFNMYGERVSEIYRGQGEAGVSLDLKWDARNATPGVYLIKATIGGSEVLQERLVVVK